MAFESVGQQFEPSSSLNFSGFFAAVKAANFTTHNNNNIIIIIFNQGAHSPFTGKVFICISPVLTTNS